MAAEDAGVENGAKEKTDNGDGHVKTRIGTTQRVKNVADEYWPVGLKVLEILICCSALALAFDPIQTVGLGRTDLHHVGLVYTAFTGYMLINSVLIFSFAIRDVVPYRTAALFSAVGALIFLVASVVLIADRTRFDNELFHPKLYLMVQLNWSVAFSFANCGIMMADCILTFIWRRNFGRGTGKGRDEGDEGA